MLTRARGWLVPAGVALLVPALLVGFGVTTLAASTPKLPGNPTTGAQEYAGAPCSSCHGASLAGTSGLAPPLNPIQKLKGVSNPLDSKYLIDTITHGRPQSDSSADGFSARMAPSGGASPALSATQIKDIAAFILQQNTSGAATLSPQELARSTVEWVVGGILAMVLLTWGLARYNMRWVARKAARR
ncbi:MAG: c-type cytochrome [Candidatus Dormibacterales bacterium]